MELNNTDMFIKFVWSDLHLPEEYVYELLSSSEHIIL